MPAPAMPGGESQTHLDLKRAALRWAYEQGYRSGALEVRIPASNYRADAVAYRPADARAADGPAPLGRTAIFECKASRPDYLRDGAPEAATRDALRRSRERLAKLERNLAVHHPDLRLGETLFPEYDRRDFTGLTHEGHRKLVAEIALLERRLHARTKFARLARYRPADALYAVAAPGVLDPAELPLAWGLLVLDPGSGGLELQLRPTLLDAPARHRLDLLQRIAAKAAPWMRAAAD